MKEVRVKPLEAPYEGEVGEILAAMMPPGVEPIKLFKTMAVNPRILTKMRHGNLLDKGLISLRDREIVIDRTTARCGAEYEWGVHIAFFAQKVQLTKEQIQSLTFGKPEDAVWTEAESAEIQLVDELHDTNKVSDALWTKLKTHFSEAQILELITIVGFYHTISFTVNGLQIALEDFGARFEDYRNI